MSFLLVIHLWTQHEKNVQRQWIINNPMTGNNHRLVLKHTPDSAGMLHRLTSLVWFYRPGHWRHLQSVGEPGGDSEAPLPGEPWWGWRGGGGTPVMKWSLNSDGRRKSWHFPPNFFLLAGTHCTIIASADLNLDNDVENSPQICCFVGIKHLKAACWFLQSERWPQTAVTCSPRSWYKVDSGRFSGKQTLARPACHVHHLLYNLNTSVNSSEFPSHWAELPRGRATEQHFVSFFCCFATNCLMCVRPFRLCASSFLM